MEATVLYSENNRGYGAALNTACAHTRGEFLLFSNPDTWYFPGALQELVQACLSLPRCGAVGPRLWWDRDREFLLPPGDPVTVWTYLQETMALGWRWWGQRWESRWLRNAVRYWRCQQATPQAMLSGACLLTHRDVVAACGGFDERFQLYYEDTDWCRRVRQQGYRLYYVPNAEVAHLYNQSARQERVVTQQKFAESAVRYFQKHYGEWRWRLVSAVATTIRRRRQSRPSVQECAPIGAVTEPPQLSFTLEGMGDYLFLLSPVSSCTPAIGRFVSTPTLSLPPRVWRQLGDGDFYARVLALADLRVLKQWHWEKRQIESAAADTADSHS
jgi:GT2 family glycosyltransferase